MDLDVAPVAMNNLVLAYNSPTAEAFGLLASAPGIHRAAVQRLSERAVAAYRR